MSQNELLTAVSAGDLARADAIIRAGTRVDARDESGLTALMWASGRGDLAMVELLLKAGADPCAVDRRAGASPLHKACQGGNVEVARRLVEAGAFVDLPAATTGHTPLMDALWFKWPDVVEYLLGRGCGLGSRTAYGFTLQQHIDYERAVNVFGKERFAEAERHVALRRQADERLAGEQHLMAAVARGDLLAVRAHLDAGADVNARSPILNGFNDHHTPLHVASRDGHEEIASLLVARGADVNAVEPVFGAVPLHKSVYNGHLGITRMLARAPKINLDFAGATNGYTPLHDALWHGFADCAAELISAGARLDLRGHDGKLPADISAEVLGPQHDLTHLLIAKPRP